MAAIRVDTPHKSSNVYPADMRNQLWSGDHSLLYLLHFKMETSSISIHTYCFCFLRSFLTGTWLFYIWFCKYIYQVSTRTKHNQWKSGKVRRITRRCWEVSQEGNASEKKEDAFSLVVSIYTTTLGLSLQNRTCFRNFPKEHALKLSCFWLWFHSVTFLLFSPISHHLRHLLSSSPALCVIFCSTQT